MGTVCPVSPTGGRAWEPALSTCVPTLVSPPQHKGLCSPPGGTPRACNSGERRGLCFSIPAFVVAQPPRARTAVLEGRGYILWLLPSQHNRETGICKCVLSLSLYPAPLLPVSMPPPGEPWQTATPGWLTHARHSPST